MRQLSKFNTENEDLSDAYATGKALLDIGIIPGNDLTPEAALTKLSYVLAKDDWDLEKKIKMMQTNIVGKVKNIKEDSLDSIPSPSPSVKIQIMGRKVGLRCKGKTLLGIVKKLFVQQSLLPSNVWPKKKNQMFKTP